MGGVILGIGYFILEKESLEEKVIVLFLLTSTMGIAYIFNLWKDKDIFRENLWCVIFIIAYTYKDGTPIASNAGKILVAIITIGCIYLRRRYRVNCPATILKVLGQIFLAVVIAFQFVGYQIFYKDGLFGISVIKGICFGHFVSWCYLLVGTSEVLFSYGCMEKKQSFPCLYTGFRELVHKNFKYIIYMTLILTGVIMFVIYYPGIYSTDVITCWEDALNIADASCRTDVHSFLYVFFLALFSNATINCCYVTVFFILAYSFVTGSFLYYLYQKGIRKKWIFLALCYFTFFPNNLFMRVALWKDVPFSIAMVSLTHALTKVVLEGGTLKKVKDIVHFLMAFIAVALFRSNGLAAIALVGSLAIAGYLRKHLSKKFVNITILGVCVVMTIKIPIYRSLGVKSGPEGFSCIPFIDGIWANVFAGNDISLETETYLQSLMPMEDWKEKYRSEYCNLYVLPDGNSNPGLNLKKSIIGWGECLAQHPGTTIGARLIKTDMIWSIFKNEGADLRYNVSLHALQTDHADDFGWYWKEETHYMRILFWRYMNYFEKNLSVFYRGGLHLTIWFLLIWNAICRGRRGIHIIMAPAIGNTLALLAAASYPDYRFIWSMFLLTPFLFFSYVIYHLEINKVEGVNMIGTI